MIIVRLISGLGNQLFQYAIGRQLSLDKAVPLKLDLSFYKGQNLRSFRLNHYNILATVASQPEVDDLMNIYTERSWYAKIYRKTEKLLPKYKRRHYNEAELWKYEPELFKVSSSVYVDGYWQHYRYFESLSKVVLDELTLKKENWGPYDKMIVEIEKNESSVSIHIRRGDYITDPEAFNLFGVLTIEYYRKAIEYIKEKVINPVFYVFSDDANWAADNLRGVASVNFINMESESKDYIELDMMRKCRHNIIANSSFSWWGAFLNLNPGKIVIAPKKWVVPEEINNKINLQLPSWKTI